MSKTMTLLAKNFDPLPKNILPPPFVNEILDQIAPFKMSEKVTPLNILTPRRLTPYRCMLLINVFQSYFAVLN